MVTWYVQSTENFEPKIGTMDKYDDSYDKYNLFKCKLAQTED